MSISRPRCALAITLLALLGVSCAQGPGDTVITRSAVFTTNLDRTLEAGGVRMLTIQSGPGELKIIGEESRRQIEIAGVVKATAGRFEEATRIAGEVDLQVRSEQTENPVVTVTRPLLTGADEKYTADFTIRVPARLRIAIEDEEGDVSVSLVQGGVQVRSTSGSIRIEGVAGGATIASGAGPCTVVETSGRIEIRDGPGPLTIRGVTGDVEVRDVSGELVIQNVTGNVVAWDNPGGAQVKNIEGDVTLHRIEHSLSVVEGVDGKIVYATGAP